MTLSGPMLTPAPIRALSSMTAEGVDAVRPSLPRIHHRGDTRHGIAWPRRDNGSLKPQGLPVRVLRKNCDTGGAPWQIRDEFGRHSDDQMFRLRDGGFRNPGHLQ